MRALLGIKNYRVDSETVSIEERCGMPNTTGTGIQSDKNERILSNCDGPIG